MDSLIFVVVMAVIFVVTFYFVYSAGFIDGSNSAFRGYMNEWVEIKQRVNQETWIELQKAYTVMHERKEKLRKRSEK